MPRAAGLEKKEKYIEKLHSYLTKYQKIIIVGVDMVTSNQIQQVRIALRGKAEVLMGKNTLMRKAIRGHLEQNPQVEKLLPSIKTNIGLVFTNEELTDIRAIINKNRLQSVARAGVVAPQDVTVPKQQTPLEPTQTSFFQALNIATKINKGAIEIINDVHLIKTGDKVGVSEAALLNKLGIKPFSYGLELISIYENGSIFSPKVLDLTEADMLASFSAGVATIAAVGLSVGYPTLASIPYSVINGFKDVLGVCMELDFHVPQLDAIKAAMSAPKAAAAAPAASAAAPAAKAEEKKPAKKESSSEEDMGLGLFD